jgi:hypothetical protein
VKVRDYDVGKILGEGGMGRVYAARHVRLGEDVALKELLIKDPGMQQQFLPRRAIAAPAFALVALMPGACAIPQPYGPAVPGTGTTAPRRAPVRESGRAAPEAPDVVGATATVDRPPARSPPRVRSSASAPTS